MQSRLNDQPKKHTLSGLSPNRRLFVCQRNLTEDDSAPPTRHNSKQAQTKELSWSPNENRHNGVSPRLAGMPSSRIAAIPVRFNLLVRVEEFLTRTNARLGISAPDVSLHRRLGQHAPFGDVAGASSCRILAHNLGFTLRKSKAACSFIECSHALIGRKFKTRIPTARIDIRNASRTPTGRMLRRHVRANGLLSPSKTAHPGHVRRVV